MGSKAYIEYKGLITHRGMNALISEIEKFIMTGIKKIDIGISSGGGDSHAGVNAYDYIVNLNKIPDVNIDTINLDVCHSSAILLYLSGRSKRSIKGSCFLIHQGSVNLNGPFTIDSLKIQIELLNNINERYISIVKKYIYIKDYYKETLIDSNFIEGDFINIEMEMLEIDHKYVVHILSSNENSVFVDRADYTNKIE